MLIRYLLNGKEINLTSDSTIIKSNNFNVDKNGRVQIIDTTSNNATDAKNANFTVVNSEGNRKVEIIPNRILISGETAKSYMWNTSSWAYIGVSSDNDIGRCRMISAGSDLTFIDCTDGTNTTEIKPTGITTPKLTQTSLESQKKNIEKVQDNALDIIKNIDIYKYNLKSEKDADKKHIGFVIGDDYNYSKEVTSTDNQGVDNYSFTSLCCKAIQELAEQNKQLQKRIEILEKEVNNG